MAPEAADGDLEAVSGLKRKLLSDATLDKITASPRKVAKPRHDKYFLATTYHLSIVEAAAAHNMCLTAFKTHCRSLNVLRWPKRQVDSIVTYNKPLQEEQRKAREEGGEALLVFYNRILEMKKQLLSGASRAPRLLKHDGESAQGHQEEQWRQERTVEAADIPACCLAYSTGYCPDHEPYPDVQ